MREITIMQEAFSGFPSLISAEKRRIEIRRLATKRQIHSIDFDILQTFPEILLYSPSD
jgi:hypothetical protein